MSRDVLYAMIPALERRKNRGGTLVNSPSFTGVLPLFLRLSDAGTMAYKTSLDVSELLWTPPTQRTLQRSSPKIL